CSLVGAAMRSQHDGPLHMVVATRNLGWLQLEHSRWVREAATVLGTHPQDLRKLMQGLRSGEIRRLLILADGPHPPGQVGVRALSGISAALGFRTPLLERMHALGVPLRSIPHYWE